MGRNYSLFHFLLRAPQKPSKGNVFCVLNPENGLNTKPETGELAVNFPVRREMQPETSLIQAVSTASFINTLELTT
jgi:hypothetical protein